MVTCRATVLQDPRAITAVVVFHHGFGDNSCYYAQELMFTLAKRYGYLTICMDCPSMGRSDGLFMYVPDWMTFVDQNMEFLKAWVSPKRAAWNGASPLAVEFYGG